MDALPGWLIVLITPIACEAVLVWLQLHRGGTYAISWFGPAVFRPKTQVESNLSAAQIKDLLWAEMGASDKLLVLPIGRNSSWEGFADSDTSWLSSHL
jgi:hypothetical protein